MTTIPPMEKPAVAHQIFALKFHDGSTRKVYVTDEEYELSSQVIFSSTDLKGIITKVNTPFLEASGWDEQDLVGQPHYILRHPHMPAAAFKEMWDTISAGKTWNGYVKNLRKNGGYYWVHAIVHTMKEDGKVVGYQSARHRISDTMKEKYEKLYAEMR